ncbi:MAG: hypothetical protein E6K65_14830 [Nitrospirae bacterium]|nr:MAG: hypothetical protein E6K65_14830 [Nitrospirota bacterium]
MARASPKPYPKSISVHSFCQGYGEILLTFPRWLHQGQRS